jgi:hypothetical protein
MNDPRQEMRNELDDAVGYHVDRETADRALDGPPRSRFAQIISDNELLLGITLAGMVVVGIILSLALNSWLFLVVAIAVHAIGTVAVTALAIWLATSGDKPDPRTVARLEQEGVRNPEQVLNDAVQDVRSDGDGGGRLADSVKRR